MGAPNATGLKDKAKVPEAPKPRAPTRAQELANSGAKAKGDAKRAKDEAEGAAPKSIPGAKAKANPSSLMSEKDKKQSELDKKLGEADKLERKDADAKKKLEGLGKQNDLAKKNAE